MDEARSPGRENAQPTSLGLVELKAGTFEHDVTVGSGYQNFSAELLRLSLAGLGVVGFVASQLHAAPEGEHPIARLPSCVKVQLALAIASLTLAAGFALLHRYYATDSLANHLALVRTQRIGGEASDLRQQRQSGFRLSSALLFGSSLTLWLGALFLGVAFLLSLP